MTEREADQSGLTFPKTLFFFGCSSLVFSLLCFTFWVLQVFRAEPEPLHKVWSEVRNRKQVLILPGWAAAQCGNARPCNSTNGQQGATATPGLVEGAGLWAAYVALVVTSFSCALSPALARVLVTLFPVARVKWWRFSCCVLLWEWGIVFPCLGFPQSTGLETPVVCFWIFLRTTHNQTHNLLVEISDSLIQETDSWHRGSKRNSQATNWQQSGN